MLNLKSWSKYKAVMGFYTKAINLWINAGQRKMWMRIGSSEDITKWYMEHSEASGQQGWLQACLVSSLQPQLPVAGDPGHLPASCRKDVPPWRIFISWWCMTEKSGSNSPVQLKVPRVMKLGIIQGTFEPTLRWHSLSPFPVEWIIVSWLR